MFLFCFYWMPYFNGPHPFWVACTLPISPLHTVHVHSTGIMPCMQWERRSRVWGGRFRTPQYMEPPLLFLYWIHNSYSFILRLSCLFSCQQPGSRAHCLRNYCLAVCRLLRTPRTIIAVLVISLVSYKIKTLIQGCRKHSKSDPPNYTYTSNEWVSTIRQHLLLRPSLLEGLGPGIHSMCIHQSIFSLEV